jgi:hypothetical protein
VRSFVMDKVTLHDLRTALVQNVTLDSRGSAKFRDQPVVRCLPRIEPNQARNLSPAKPRERDRAAQSPMCLLSSGDRRTSISR